uniref:Leucine-rich repeat-containing protein 51 n=1 Tax=Cacopsylla melanoneura TaxID=428564 RepID=A0A8D8T7D8_9HEMI
MQRKPTQSNATKSKDERPKRKLSLNRTNLTVDLSYRNIDILNTAAAAQVKPRHCSNAAHLDEAVARYDARILRLNNNSLSSLTGLDEFIQKILVSPETLTWLDLSFNQVTRLDESLSTLQSITILYLHGNQLQSLSDILKSLQSLPKLTHLTLNGNPPFQLKTPHYRSKVITSLNTLISLDFASVTKWERQLAQDRAHSVTIAKQTLKKKPIRHFYI